MSSSTNAFTYTPVWHIGIVRTLLALLCLACPLALAEVVNLDPTEPGAKIVSLVQPDALIDKPAPATQFTQTDGEALWKQARDRALIKMPHHGGGAFDMSLVPDDFRSATNFYTERYNPGESSEGLQMIISASEARKNGSKLELTQMRLIYFIKETPPPKEVEPVVPINPAVQVVAGGGEVPLDPPKKSKKDKKGADPTAAMSMPGGGRLVILAPKCEINLETNVGHAFGPGGATIEIFPKPEDGKPLRSIAKLASPFIRWRSWNEAALGSSEMVLYTCDEKGGDDEPEVSGTYVNLLPDGSESTINVKGRGMIFESGTFDRLTPRADEDDRTVCLSNVARSRAIFHSRISTEMTASTIQSLMPFQGEAAAGAGKKDDKKPKKKPPAETEPELTTVTCDGPAIFDLAFVPRLNDNVVENVTVAESVEVDLIEKPLGKRFEFLNRVTLVKKPVATAAVPEPQDTTTRMSCGHLRIQYPAGGMPNASSLPDYTEAIGGVRMAGFKPPPPPEPGQENLPPQPPTPFSISCARMFFDGTVRDSMFLVDGVVDGKYIPARVIDTKGIAQAQQFCFRRKTQMMTMPSIGPKQLIFRSNAMTQATPPPTPAGTAPAAPSPAGMLGGGDIIISWNGPLYREIHHLPVPHQRDILKEILTLNNDVVIEQKESGLKMTGAKIRIYMTEKDGVDFIDAAGDVEIVMGELKAVGHVITVDMGMDDKTQAVKNLITVIGNRKLGKKADVFKGQGTAVRSDKFIIDRVADNFSAFGGTVALVKSETPQPAAVEPKPETAVGAEGLMGGIKFGGGDIFIQCDGEFIQNGKSHTVTADQNVLIRQPGMTLLSNNVLITLGDDGAPADPKKTDPAKTAPAKNTPANALFSGDLKAIECFGMVEVALDDKLIHCDIMKFDAEKDETILDMLDTEDDVRVYIHGADGVDQVMCARHSLKLDKKTGTFTPGGKMLIRPYKDPVPAARGAENSPTRKKDK